MNTYHVHKDGNVELCFELIHIVLLGEDEFLSLLENTLYYCGLLCISLTQIQCFEMYHSSYIIFELISSCAQLFNAAGLYVV